MRAALFFILMVVGSLGFGQEQSFAERYDGAKHDTTRAICLAEWGESLYRNQPDSAILLFEQALAICEKSIPSAGNDRLVYIYETIRASMYNNLAYMYEQQGNIPLALEYNDRAVKMYESEGDTLLLANSLNNIGFIYYKQQEFEKALEYYERSADLKEAIDDKRGLAQTLNNIGLLFKKQEQYNKALSFYDRSLSIRRSLNDSLGISNSLGNIGFLYKEMNDYMKALEYYDEVIRIQRLIDDHQGLSGSLSNAGMIHLDMEDYELAMQYGEEALALAQELGYPEPISKAAGLLYQVHDTLGNHELALEQFQLFVQMRDSVFNKETQAATIRQQVQYEYEKEQIEAQKERKKQEAVDQAHRETLQVIIYSVSGGLGLVLLFSIFLINRVRVINRQKRVIEDQKMEVEEKNKEITDSINYASRIQKAILTSDEYLDQIFADHFVLYQPQSIVSGDFYWAYKVNDKLIWAAVDCTGHGVPGAFMSMIGTALLNEIIVENGITEPKDILNRLRNGVIKALEQKAGKTKQRDGMDMALCVLDTDNNKLLFAGANNPLWIVQVSGNLIEIKGDKQPVGLSDEQVDFKQHEISLDPGDMIYIFSDGYADQFGGPHGKKFKYKPLKDLLVELRNKPVNEQREKLFTTFEEWKGNLEQVDDVCVFGVRLN